VPQTVIDSSNNALVNVESVSLGLNHACAISNGNVYCWGNNEKFNDDGSRLADNFVGKVGVNTINNFFLKAQSLGDTAQELALGMNHSCLLNNGVVLCFGSNANKQLGNSSAGSEQSNRTFVTTMSSDVNHIFSGSHHICGIKGGESFCWGRNTEGQLGNNNTLDSFNAVQTQIDNTGTAFLQGVTQLALGFKHSCGIADGKAYCWGANNAGQIGDTTTIDKFYAVPTYDTDLNNVTTLVAGSKHNCAIGTAGKIYCWGENGLGQIGTGSNSPAFFSNPVLVTNTILINPMPANDTYTMENSNYLNLSSNSTAFRTCAVNGGKYICWGKNGKISFGTGIDGDEYSTPLDLSRILYIK
jgi:alpha-tubulin suppressor-like RCC1 family protein